MVNTHCTGYIRFPTIHGDCIVFTAEDDLWRVTVGDERAERLTAGVAEATDPRFSPDGQCIAFTGCDEGPTEVYVMPASGGSVQRLTYHSYRDGDTRAVGWTPDSNYIIYATSSGQPFRTRRMLYQVHRCGGEPRLLRQYGIADAIAHGPHNGVVLGRHTLEDRLHWKGYRGGMAGQLWVDSAQTGGLQQILVDLCGHITSPCWVGDRIYFISDHEGTPQDAIGNVYSCLPDGNDRRRHTHQRDYYARGLATDGERLVFHAGGALFLLDPQAQMPRRLEFELPSTRTQRARRFAKAVNYLEKSQDYALQERQWRHVADLHPNGHALAITARGKAYSTDTKDGPVIQYGDRDGTRYRLLTWVAGGKYLVAIADTANEGYEEPYLVLFKADGSGISCAYKGLAVGHVVDLVASPAGLQVALANQSFELLLIDLANGKLRHLDRSDYGEINGIAWSPDGQVLAYGFAINAQRTAVKLCRVSTGEICMATEPVRHDTQPTFDPYGNYLYFLGMRDYSQALGSIGGTRPYAIPLRREIPSPYSAPHASGSSPMRIECAHITERAIALSVEAGDYTRLLATRGGLIYARKVGPKARLFALQFRSGERELVDQLDDVWLSGDGETLLYLHDHTLRTTRLDQMPPATDPSAHKQPGAEVSLERIKVSVQPGLEWRQMYFEAWRLQRDYFWRQDMNGLNWEAVRERYAPLIDQVATRSELADVIWEMQGELRASHANEGSSYAGGVAVGDYRRPTHYEQGFLGVDWEFDESAQCYRIGHIVRGDVWNAGTPRRDSRPRYNYRASSPLLEPGLDVLEDDIVLAIDGEAVTRDRGPQQLLVNKAGSEVALLMQSATTGHVHVISVRALFSHEERGARYRDWVERNRGIVSACTNGAVGYIHLPDMSGDENSNGRAEFYRAYRVAYDCSGLIIDVRWNTGGNISPEIIGLLTRKRLGYKYPQRGAPRPFPEDSPRGPMVALINEMTLSDAETFSHLFKTLQLGTLVGKRTWGGQIYIYSQGRSLADNASPTQPELGLCFLDEGVRCTIENAGVTPSDQLEVDCAPQDYTHNTDTQLVHAITEVLYQVRIRPAVEPAKEPWVSHHEPENQQLAG
jgi:tricorn protease